MKNLTKTLIAFILSLNLVGQTLNPKQYAVLNNEEIQIEKGKRKDGTYSCPNLTTDKNIRFSPNGDYLFIYKDDEKTEGKLVIYNVTEKRVVKTIKIPKTGMYLTEGFTINPKNIYQVAITANKAEVIVIMDWSKVSEDALISKASEGIKKIKASCQYGGKYSFSEDGKIIYILEDDDLPIKSVDLESGKISLINLPKGKKIYYLNETNPFLGNDEVLIISENATNPASKTAEIFHLPTNQVTRTYDISGYTYNPHNYGYNPHLLIFGYDGIVYNLKTGEKDETAKKITEGLGSTKDNSVRIYPIPGKGYLATHLFYQTTKGSYYTKYVKTTVTNTSTQSNLFFFDILADKPLDLSFPDVNRTFPWTDLYQLQISSNCKFAVFQHVDINDSKNSRWIIVEL